MLNAFKEHFEYSEEQLKDLWTRCIFCLDANVLLNFYRYSTRTKNQLLGVLESLGDRLWIPHRSAYEFFFNRLNVIGQQEKAYSDMFDKLTELKEILKNKRKHPFLSNVVYNKFDLATKAALDELERKRQQLADQILNDEIKNQLGELLFNKIGEEFTDDELADFSKIAEKRYQTNTPPGFKDKNKDSDQSVNFYRKYGDFFIWKQILIKAKQEDASVIFITEDRKDDWWLRFKGKIISPRPELMREFDREIGKYFYMYQTDKFLEYSKIFLNKTITDETITELREIRIIGENESDEERSEVIVYEIPQERLKLKKEIEWIDFKIAKLRELISEIESEESIDIEASERLKNFKNELYQSIAKRNDLDDKMTRVDLEETVSDTEN